MSTTKTQYLTAHATLQLDEDSYLRTKHLNDEQILGSKPLVAARIAMHQARTSLLNAEQKLRNFRFDDAALALILKTNDTQAAPRYHDAYRRDRGLSPCRDRRSGRADDKALHRGGSLEDVAVDRRL